MKKFLEKFKKQTNLTTQIIAVVGIVLVVNFLSYQIFTRFDLTENKIYSISKTSKETVKNLNDIVNIKIYFSENLPPQYINVRQEVEDILDEYQNYANNKLSIEFIDPKDDEKLQRDLQLLGIPKLQFNILENDKYEVISGYLGMVAQYGDNKQAIPVINSTQNLEYQLTSAIKKVTIEKIPTIAFATGHGEFKRAEELAFLDKKLSEIYTIRDVDLSAGTEIPEDINTLIIAGSKEVFTDRAQYIIDQFVMRGGNVLFMLDGVTIDESLQAKPNEATLARLLGAYGIKIENYFVLDTQNDKASFNQGFLNFSVEYPFFVKVNETGLNQENAAVAKLQNLILPWSSPITIDSAIENIKVLAWTTAEAWTMKDVFNLSPQGNFGFQNDPESYNLIVSRIGNINSAFSSYIPKENETGNHISSTEEGKIIIVGDADFISDTFTRRYVDNLVFTQNIVDFISLDSDLINIRAKEVSDRPLEEITDARKKSIKYFNVFGVTIIVLAFGLIRYYLRKKSKFADEL